MKTIKKAIAEATGMEYESISSSMHLEEDLSLDAADIDDLLDMLEDRFNIEFGNRDDDMEYVSDLVAFVKGYL